MSAQIRIVRWLNGGDVVGFILPETAGKDLFAHISGRRTTGAEAIGSLRVWSEVGPAHDGPRAAIIRHVM